MKPKLHCAIDRRGFLKYAGAAVGGMAAMGWSRRGWTDAGDRGGFVQQVQHARFYMTHYALFEEADPTVPNGIFLDAATGMPTNELLLAPPLETIAFGPGARPTEYVAASAGPVKRLPYVVSPPGFPPLPAPPEVLGAISAVLSGVPLAVIAAGTGVFLVAIGHFEPTGAPLQAVLAGSQLHVTRDVEFQVQIRTGFLFQPPAGLAVPPVGILTGYLTFGLLHQLIGLPPPPNATDIVTYDWHAPMTLSTENRFVRDTATEPPPVADAFPAGMKQISFIGRHIDQDGHYTIVGHAEHTPFDAPPELVQFLFGQTVLTDVEFAIEESGILLPG